MKLSLIHREIHVDSLKLKEYIYLNNRNILKGDTEI